MKFDTFICRKCENATKKEIYFGSDLCEECFNRCDNDAARLSGNAEACSWVLDENNEVVLVGMDVVGATKKEIYFGPDLCEECFNSCNNGAAFDAKCLRCINEVN